MLFSHFVVSQAVLHVFVRVFVIVCLHALRLVRNVFISFVMSLVVYVVLPLFRSVGIHFVLFVSCFFVRPVSISSTTCCHLLIVAFIHSPSAFPPPCHLPWTGGRAPLNSLWVPVGFFRSPLVASWAPPGYLLGSPGSLWLPLASFWTPLGSPWVLFGCPLAPLGLHLVSLGFHRGACGTSFG